MIISIEEALEHLKSEDVVAIPTETVYGLAGLITSEKALKKIFEVKKRPFFDPLIVHVTDTSQAQGLTSEWPLIAEKLAEKYWPGPLTLVLRKRKLVSDLITAGLERVGIRCPQHPVAQEILNKLKIPLAAPSANLFGHTSPTLAQHVESEFQSQIPVVEGGASSIGIESTVLLIDQDEIAILRPGHILAQEIEDYLKAQNISFKWKAQITKSESPGHMKHHYMPSKPLFWVEGKIPSDILETLNLKLRELPDQVEGVQIQKPSSLKTYSLLQFSSSPQNAARSLYSELRRLAEGPADCLIFQYQSFMSQPEWAPVLERLRKASSIVIKTSS